MIIESAPVSLTITTQDGTILAANARSLRLFQVEKLEGLIGTKFDRLISAADRATVSAALENVCKGADAHLTYRVADGASAGRSVEMRAVPLRRDGAAPAVCLTATWETADVKSPALAAPAATPNTQALEQALEEARTALATMTRTREAERLAVGDALLQTRQRLQAALAEAEQRHVEAEERLAQATIQWAAERESLNADLAQARTAGGAASSQLTTLHTELAQARDAASAAAARLESSNAELAQAREAAGQAAARLNASQAELSRAKEAADAAGSQLASSRSELAQVRDAGNATAAQLAAVNADLLQTREAAKITAAQLAASNEQRLRAEEHLAASNEQRLRAEEQLAASNRRVEELERTARELEERYAQVSADRQADRLEFHEMVRTEQSKYDTLLSHQARREAALADIARLLQDAALRTERLLGDQPVDIASQVQVQVAAVLQADLTGPKLPSVPESALPEPAPAAEPAVVEEDLWQF